MGLLDILAAPIKGLIGSAGAIIDNVHTSEEEKLEAKAKFQALATQAEAQVLAHAESLFNAKRDIIVAELQQGDTYTKRARPTVVYGGLLILTINHIVLPWIAFFSGMEVPKIEIPAVFWGGWSGIVMTWSIGRSAEKRGMQNKMIGVITGGG